MTQQSRRFLRLKDVKYQVGLSRSAIYSKIKTGDFPKSYLLGARGSRAVAWLSDEIDSWIESRIELGRKEAVARAVAGVAESARAESINPAPQTRWRGCHERK